MEVLTKFGGIRFTLTIGRRAANNLLWLERGGWTLIEEQFCRLLQSRSREPRVADAHIEREAARFVDAYLEGFGPKQARNLWQWLGLTRYEIPIDSRITEWFNRNTSHPEISVQRLANRKQYESVMDDLQALCGEINQLPCVLDAAIFASFDRDWRPEELQY
jgi:hypothetical protein